MGFETPTSIQREVMPLGLAGASGDAFNLASREDSPALARIERTLGRQLPRVSVDGVTQPERPRPSTTLASSRSRLRGRGRPLRRTRRR